MRAGIDNAVRVGVIVREIRVVGLTAESELKHALELDPKIFPARIMLVNVFIQMGMWQEALDNADIFLIENPGSRFRSDVSNTRTQVLQRLQRAVPR